MSIRRNKDRVGPLGPCYGGYSSTEATRFYQNVRKQRADKMPVTVKTTLLFAQVMRMRFGNFYSAKAQNIARILRKALRKMRAIFCAFAE